MTDSKKLEVIDGGQHQAQTQTPEPPPTNAPAQRIGGYSVPRGYEVWQNGVYRIDEIPENAITEQPALVKIPSAERRRGLRSVTRRPLWIRSLGRALDADETLLQLAYYEASNNKAPRFEWVSQLQISDRRQLVQLAHGARLFLWCHRKTLLAVCEAGGRGLPAASLAATVLSSMSNGVSLCWIAAPKGISGRPTVRNV